MSEVRFSSTASPPGLMNGGFEVVSARFTLRAADVLGLLEEQRENLARWEHPPPLVLAETWLKREVERHRRFLLWSRVVAEVGAAAAAGRDVEWAAGDHAAVWCQGLTFAGRFVRVECSRCDRAYAAPECATLDWAYRAAPLMGMGGQRVACPAGHTLFAQQTWLS